MKANQDFPREGFLDPPFKSERIEFKGYYVVVTITPSMVTIIHLSAATNRLVVPLTVAPKDFIR